MRNEHENPHRGKPDELRDKAVRLFTYLKEVCQLRFVVVRDCRNYDQLLWFHDIPREPECFCIAWNGPTETNESWIEVRRSPEPACPPIPPVCKDWVSLADLANSAQTPTLRERVLVSVREGEPPRYVELSQQPDVQAKWKTTAEQDKMIEDAIARARANQQANAHASSVR